MNIDDLRLYLDEAAKLFNADNVVSEREAQMRAGRSLEAQHHISLAILHLSTQLIKLSSLRDITYAQIMAQDTAKNVTEKKVNVEANPTYIAVKEQVEEIEGNLNYLRTQGKLHENTHIFYRKFLRELSNG